ncbi:MAG: TolC family protein [Spirochaetia bacterium]|nr:TolC family protein [Spirochaetia bacterium]
MKNTIITIFFIAGFISPVLADVYTEKQAVDAVINNSPAISAAQKRHTAAQASSHASWWIKNPMFEVEFMGIDGRTLSLAGTGSKNVSISQEIPFPFKMPYRIGATNENVAAAGYKLESVRREVAVSAHSVYASLYRTIREIEITKQSSDILKQVSRAAAARYGRDSGAGEDASKADLEYALLINRVQELEQEKGIKIEALKSMSSGGFTIAPDSDITAPQIPVMALSEEEVTKAALENSPELLAAAAEMKMNENIRNASFMEYIPDVTVRFTKQAEPDMGDYSLMFGFEVPLWFPATQQSMIGSAGDEYDAAAKEYEQMKNNTILEVKQLYQSVLTHARTMKLYSEILIPQAEAALQAQIASYKTRRTDFMRVLDSERMLLEMKRDYYMHMEEYVGKYYELGAMTEAG